MCTHVERSGQFGGISSQLPQTEYHRSSSNRCLGFPEPSNWPVFFIIKIYLFSVYKCFPTYMYVCRVCAWCLKKSEDIGSPGVGVTDDNEPSCGYWEPNSGPLQEQPGI